MKKLLVAIACVAIGLFVSLGFSAVAQNQPAAVPTPTNPISASPTRMADVDRQFMMMAGEAGLANIAMSQMALQKSNNSAVQQFAQAEITEQQMVKQKLSQVAPRMGVSLPTAPGPKYQALMAKLSQLSDARFDQAYLNEGGVNAHLENAAIYQREAQFGQVPDVIAIANQGLPIIQQHFSTASRLTDYRFAKVSQRFNNPVSSGISESNNIRVAPETNR